MRFLITRPEPDASELAQTLRRLGHDSVIEPLLEFQPMPWSVGEALSGAKGLIITSGNALRALASAPHEMFAPLKSLPLYCVGEATAEKARGLGLSQPLAIAASAEELAHALLRSNSPSPLLHLCGEHQAFDLQQALQDKGQTLCTIPIYTMRARTRLSEHVAEDLRTGRINSVMVLSPRTAEILHSLCVLHKIETAIQKITFFCLSRAIADKLMPLDVRRVRVAKEPKLEAMFDLVKAESDTKSHSACE